MNHKIQITESARDAFQSIKLIIPTDVKVKYINQLLTYNFDVLDLGSFVSSKSLPQMEDTEKVLDLINETDTKVMVLVGNPYYAELALKHSKINILSYPDSVSPTFLYKNICSTIIESEVKVLKIAEIAEKSNKKFRVYITMAFGNPYGDEYQSDMIYEKINLYLKKGISNIVLTDVTGEARPDLIKEVFSNVHDQFPELECGFHLHTDSFSWKSKISAAFDANCRNYESVFNQLGGCPFTGYEFLSNLDTVHLTEFLNEKLILDEKSTLEIHKLSDSCKKILKGYI